MTAGFKIALMLNGAQLMILCFQILHPESSWWTMPANLSILGFSIGRVIGVTLG